MRVLSRWSRSAVRRAATVLLTTAALAVTGAVTAAPANAAVTYNCLSAPGAGTYANPWRIGVVTQTTVLVGCRSIGSPAAVYFSYSYARPASAGSYVMTYYQVQSVAQPEVHPALALGLVTVLPATSAQFYQDATFSGFYQLTSGAQAGVAWSLRPTRLKSRLSTLLNTPTYNIIIQP